MVFREVTTASSFTWLLQHLSSYIFSFVCTLVSLHDLYDLKKQQQKKNKKQLYLDRTHSATNLQARRVAFLLARMVAPEQPVIQHKKCSKLSCRDGQATRETMQMLQNMTDIFEDAEVVQNSDDNKTFEEAGGSFGPCDQLLRRSISSWQ